MPRRTTFRTCSTKPPASYASPKISSVWVSSRPPTGGRPRRPPIVSTSRSGRALSCRSKRRRAAASSSAGARLPHPRLRIREAGACTRLALAALLEGADAVGRSPAGGTAIGFILLCSVRSKGMLAASSSVAAARDVVEILLEFLLRERPEVLPPSCFSALPANPKTPANTVTRRSCRMTVNQPP